MTRIKGFSESWLNEFEAKKEIAKNKALHDAKGKNKAKDVKRKIVHPALPNMAETGKNLLVAIDPDIDNCGVAIYDRNECSFVNITTMPFFKLMESIEFYKKFALVLIESPSMISRSNFHNAQGANVRERIAQNVGQNIAVSKLIVQYCIEKGIAYKELKPAGYSKLFKKVAFFKKETGWDKRTNEDARAAAAMIWCNR